MSRNYKEDFQAEENLVDAKKVFLTSLEEKLDVLAENILYELMSTLNMDAGEIADNLMRLYDFMIWQLIEANRDKDKNKVESVIELLLPLCDAWKQIVEKDNIAVVKTPVNREQAKSINFAG